MTKRPILFSKGTIDERDGQSVKTWVGRSAQLSGCRWPGGSFSGNGPRSGRADDSESSGAESAFVQPRPCHSQSRAVSRPQHGHSVSAVAVREGRDGDLGEEGTGSDVPAVGRASAERNQNPFERIRTLQPDPSRRLSGMVSRCAGDLDGLRNRLPPFLRFLIAKTVFRVRFHFLPAGHETAASALVHRGCFLPRPSPQHP